MLKINENGFVNAKDIYSFVGVKTRFDMWIKRCINYATLCEQKDFCTVLVKSTGGRPLTEYYFTVSAAKEVCIVSATEKAKELRLWLIEIGRQRENLELFSESEIIQMSKLEAFFKYVENQKEIYKLHGKDFADKSNSNNPYAEFNIYRNNILGIDKIDLENSIKQYCIENSKRMPKIASNFDKIRFLNEYDSLKNAVWDFLEIRGEINSLKIAELVKKMAQAQNLQFLPKNEDNLFQKKEQIEIKQIFEK
jgi:phage anti-repressor protein